MARNSDTWLTANAWGGLAALATAVVQGACGESGGSIVAAKVAYRFLDNEAVDWKAILEAHYKSREERLREKGLVVVQDTRRLNHSFHHNTKGPGPIRNDSGKVRGLMVHDPMVFTPEGCSLWVCLTSTVLGAGWNRGKDERQKKPVEQKESWKWVESC